jgi:hypothetical protein
VARRSPTSNSRIGEGRRILEVRAIATSCTAGRGRPRGAAVAILSAPGRGGASGPA